MIAVGLLGWLLLLALPFVVPADWGRQPIEEASCPACDAPAWEIPDDPETAHCEDCGWRGPVSAVTWTPR